MMGFSTQHLLLLAVIVVLLFGGRGKISAIMGDFAKGIRSFRKGLTDDGDAGAIEFDAARPERTKQGYVG